MSVWLGCLGAGGGGEGIRSGFVSGRRAEGGDAGANCAVGGVVVEESVGVVGSGGELGRGGGTWRKASSVSAWMAPLRARMLENVIII